MFAVLAWACSAAVVSVVASVLNVDALFYLVVAGVVLFVVLISVLISFLVRMISRQPDSPSLSLRSMIWTTGLIYLAIGLSAIPIISFDWLVLVGMGISCALLFHVALTALGRWYLRLAKTGRRWLSIGSTLGGLYVTASLVFLFLLFVLPIFGDPVSKDLIKTATSPDGRMVVKCYRVNGGATVDFAVKCDTLGQSGEMINRNVYDKYHTKDAELQWIDNRTIEINGIPLDARKGTYDWRDE